MMSKSLKNMFEEFLVALTNGSFSLQDSQSLLNLTKLAMR